VEYLVVELLDVRQRLIKLTDCLFGATRDTGQNVVSAATKTCILAIGLWYQMTWFLV